MAEWKRTIPRVAAATLVLGGTSCGGKKPTIPSVARLSCVAYSTCEPTYFSNYYSSVDACAAVVTAELYDYRDYYEYIYGFEIDPHCEAAYLNYLDCYYGAYRRTCNEALAEADCIQEYIHASEDCMFF